MFMSARKLMEAGLLYCTKPENKKNKGKATKKSRYAQKKQTIRSHCSQS